MQIEQYARPSTVPTIQLKDVKPGDVFRFAEDTFEEALESNLFYIRLDVPEAKDRIRAADLATGKVIERDGDRRVLPHRSTIQIAK